MSQDLMIQEDLMNQFRQNIKNVIETRKRSQDQHVKFESPFGLTKKNTNIVLKEFFTQYDISHECEYNSKKRKVLGLDCNRTDYVCNYDTFFIYKNKKFNQ